jgi:ribosome-binding protein aMBF1 (putative translation factor)
MTTGDVDAREYAAASIAAALRVARERAGLTVAELAAKMGKPMGVIADTESGRAPATEAHVLAALAACGLPKDSKP